MPVWIAPVLRFFTVLVQQFGPYLIGWWSGRKSAQNAELKESNEIKDKQAEARRDAPKSKSDLLDELRSGDSF